MTTDEKTVAKLARVAETVATEECEGRSHGHPECLVLYQDENDWCLSCLAKRAMADYMSG